MEFNSEFDIAERNKARIGIRNKNSIIKSSSNILLTKLFNSPKVKAQKKLTKKTTHLDDETRIMKISVS